MGESLEPVEMPEEQQSAPVLTDIEYAIAQVNDQSKEWGGGRNERGEAKSRVHLDSSVNVARSTDEQGDMSSQTAKVSYFD